jgi:hypothetical protein
LIGDASVFRIRIADSFGDLEKYRVTFCMALLDGPV